MCAYVRALQEAERVFKRTYIFMNVRAPCSHTLGISTHLGMRAPEISPEGVIICAAKQSERVAGG